MSGEFLREVQIKELLSDKPKDLVKIFVSASAKSALELLHEHKVLSVPISDPGSPHDFSGFIDVFDIMTFVVLSSADRPMCKEVIESVDLSAVEVFSLTQLSEETKKESGSLMAMKNLMLLLILSAKVSIEFW